MFLAFWRRRRQGRHSRLPLGRRQVLISFKGWPRRQWVCRAARADGPSPRNTFSRGVTGSMWAGKMQGRFRQRWSDSSPSGIGPTSVSYAKRCACRNLAVRSRRLPTLNRPYPVRRVAVHSQHPFSKTRTFAQKRAGKRGSPKVKDAGPASAATDPAMGGKPVTPLGRGSRTGEPIKGLRLCAPLSREDPIALTGSLGRHAPTVPVVTFDFALSLAMRLVVCDVIFPPPWISCPVKGQFTGQTSASTVRTKIEIRSTQWVPLIAMSLRCVDRGRPKAS